MPPRPAKARVTSFDIALKVGVSQPTVSRALRGSKRVSPETRAKILEAAQELNYIVDRNASSLRTQATNVIALVVICQPGEHRTAINPFYFSLLGCIAAAAADEGYNLMVSFQESRGNFFGYYEDSRQADGLIIIGSARNAEAWDYFEKVQLDGRSVVCWGGPDNRFASIRSANEEGAKLAVQHMYDKGRRHIVFVGPTVSPQAQFEERYRGYARTMKDYGLTSHATYPEGALAREQEGYEATAALIRSGTKFDGIFAVCDLVALGVLRCLHDNGISVPGDVSVVGFDGIRAGEHSHPPLTTIEPDLIIAGKLLVDNLLAMMDGEDISDERAPVELLLRESD